MRSWLCLLFFALPTISAAAQAAALGATQDATREASFVEGFEATEVGEFRELRTRAGLWLVRAGAVGIDSEHADLGERCLWLHGGNGSTLDLEFEDAAPYSVSFAIERWTSRAPFAFQMEALTEQGWVELEDRSAQIRVGGFLTTVELVLPDGTSALRLHCESPADTGVLIDEFAVRPRAPMELVSVKVVQPMLPVLIERTHNPILRIDFETRGNQDPLVVSAIAVRIFGGGPDGPDISGLGIYSGPKDVSGLDGEALFSADSSFGDFVSFADKALWMNGEFELPEGQSSLWFSLSMNPTASLDETVDASIVQIHLLNGAELLTEEISPPGVQRMGRALRSAGEDGVPVYRIPGLVTTKAGSLIAVYDNRHQGWRDLPSNIDVGMSRSTDGGRNWEPMRTILDFGADPKFAYDGVGDPAILVDRNTGTIWVAATWHHGALGWNGSGPGFDPEQTGQLVLTRSDDDGLTWSAPINITRQVKQEEWAFLLQGPGRGITMENGTLVFPAQYQLSPEQGREPRATVLFSSDHGTTWQLGAEARSNTTEAAIVELEAGELMLNMRDNRGRKAPGARAVAISSDHGASWSLHPTSGKALPEPVCMASLIHIGHELDGKADGRLLFSNPAVGAAPRRDLSIQLSTDFGQTWHRENRLLLDSGVSAGYSCLTMIDAETIGIVYEGSGAHLVFQRIPLSALKGR
jgi:sialidase-1